MDTMQIIWKPIEGFPRYQVSNQGQIFDLEKDCEVKQNILPNGYPCVNLKRDKKKHLKLVHRIVAETFIPNPDNLNTVDHQDSNKTNNCVSNLSWMSRKDNTNKAHTERGHDVSRWFSCYKDDQLIERWNSQREAARALGLQQGNINRCLHNKQKTTGGYAFRYDD